MAKAEYDDDDVGVAEGDKKDIKKSQAQASALEGLTNMNRRESVEWRKIVYSVSKGKIGRIMSMEESGRIKMTRSLEKVVGKSKKKEHLADLEHQLGFSRLPDLFASGEQFNKRYRDFMEEVAKANEEGDAAEKLGAEEEDEVDGEDKMDVVVEPAVVEEDDKMELEEAVKPKEKAKEGSVSKKPARGWTDAHYQRVLALYQD